MHKPRDLIIARVITRELFLKILNVVDGDGADLIEPAFFGAVIELRPHVAECLRKDCGAVVIGHSAAVIVLHDEEHRDFSAVLRRWEGLIQLAKSVPASF